MEKVIYPRKNFLQLNYSVLLCLSRQNCYAEQVIGIQFSGKEK